MGNGVDAGSFDSYEGIRIFIPGAITVGLVAAVDATFDLIAFEFADNEITSLLAALIIGLFFYFVDAPARAAVTKSLQPTGLLQSWGRKPRDVTMLNVYLYILDTAMPAVIRARSLYMGSIFRVGLEAIYLLFLTASGVLLTAATGWSSADDRARSPSASLVDHYVIVALVVTVYVVALRREMLGRKPRQPHRLPHREAIRQKLRRPTQVSVRYDVRPVQFNWLDVGWVVGALCAYGAIIYFDEVGRVPRAV
jgi:hypothetical protein